MALSPNEKILNSGVLYDIDVERSVVRLQNDVVSRLNGLERQIGNALFQSEIAGYSHIGRSAANRLRRAVVAEIDEKASEAYETVGRWVDSDLRVQGAVAENQLAGSVENSGAVDDAAAAVLVAALLTRRRREAIVADSLVEGAKIGELWRDEVDLLVMDVNRKLRSAIRSNMTNAEIISFIRGNSVAGVSEYRIGRSIGAKLREGHLYACGVMDDKRHYAKALVRSATTAVINNVRLELMRKNSRILRGLLFVAVLDTRTTMTCRNLSGRLYDLDLRPLGHGVVLAHLPPMHVNCRSRIQAVLLNGGDIPKDYRFDDWLAAQTEAVQKEALGAERYKMWRRGEIRSIRDLVDQNSRPLNLDELRRKYGRRRSRG